MPPPPCPLRNFFTPQSIISQTHPSAAMHDLSFLLGFHELSQINSLSYVFKQCKYTLAILLTFCLEYQLVCVYEKVLFMIEICLAFYLIISVQLHILARCTIVFERTKVLGIDKLSTMSHKNSPFTLSEALSSLSANEHIYAQLN